MSMNAKLKKSYHTENFTAAEVPWLNSNEVEARTGDQSKPKEKKVKKRYGASNRVTGAANVTSTGTGGTGSRATTIGPAVGTASPHIHNEELLHQPGAIAVPGIHQARSHNDEFSITGNHQDSIPVFHPVSVRLVEENHGSSNQLRDEVRELRERTRELEAIARNTVQAQVVAEDHPRGDGQGNTDAAWSSLWCFRTKRRQWGFVCGILLVVAVVAAILGVVLSKDDSDPQGSRAESTTPPAQQQTDESTLEPMSTPAPTMTPAPTLSQFEQLLALISSVSPYGGAALGDTSSEQYQALVWLADNEKITEYSSWRRIQRYVLAVLYYNTNGDGWSNRTGWLSNSNECSWFWKSRSSVCNKENEIKELVLFTNKLVGSLPAELALFSDVLNGLILYNNAMTGALPTELGLLSGLIEMDLSENTLSETIASEIGQLTNLVNIWLENNNINGAIPPELGQISNLSRLYIDHNNLSGTIPTNLGQLSRINELDLQQNRLKGPIPSEFGQMTQLDHLWLFNNSLTGAIPLEILQLTLLETLSLYDNMLTGSFTCPSTIDNCFISCGDALNSSCREL